MIIQRDRRGYGFTVYGDNPAYIMDVREGGAAQRAGVNKNDLIIKVVFSCYFSSRIVVEKKKFRLGQRYSRHSLHSYRRC